MRISFTRKNIIRLMVFSPTLILGIVTIGAGIEFYQWKNRNAEWYEERGDEFLLTGDYGRAMSNYMKSETLDSSRNSIHKKLGKIYLEKGILEETDEFLGAKNEYEIVYEKDSSDEEASIGLAKSYYLIGDEDRAISVLETIEDGSFEFLKFKGELRLLTADFSLGAGQVDFESASKNFERAFRKKDDLETKLYLAVASAPVDLPRTTDLVLEILEDSKNDQSSEIFQSALSVRNAILGSSEVLNPVLENYTLGQVFAQEGFPTVALHFLELANNEDPTYAPAYTLKGRMGLLLGDYRLAKSAFETVAFDLQPYNSEAIYLLAKTEAELGSRPEDALSLFEDAIAKKYYSEEMLFDYGQLFTNLGRESDAEEQFKNALTTNPAYIEAREALVSILVEGGDLDGALEIAEDAAEIFPEENLPVYEILKLQVLSSDSSTAKEALDLANSVLGMKENQFIEKNLAKIYFYRAESNRFLGNDDSAVDDYFSALNYDFIGEISEESKSRLDEYEIFDETKDFWWWLSKIT